MSIYEKKETVEAKREQLERIMRVFGEQGVEVRFKTRGDGNCFYRGVGEQLGATHGEVRREAVRYLKENETVGGELWADFVEDEDPGKGKGEKGRSMESKESDRSRKGRRYLRKMSKEGEWVEHLMVVATAGAYRRRIVIFSKEGVTVVRPDEEEGEEVLLGLVMEEHYFGVKRIRIGAQEEGRKLGRKRGSRRRRGRRRRRKTERGR